MLLANPMILDRQRRGMFIAFDLKLGDSVSILPEP